MGHVLLSRVRPVTEELRTHCRSNKDGFTDRLVVRREDRCRLREGASAVSNGAVRAIGGSIPADVEEVRVLVDEGGFGSEAARFRAACAIL